MRIACMSDLHGYLPEPVECDLALVAGDITPYGTLTDQFVFLNGRFREWCKQWPRLAFIAGNHDTIFASQSGDMFSLPPMRIYLEDQCYRPFDQFITSNRDFNDYSGLSVFGSPWSLPYGRNMAFMGTEDRLELSYNSSSARHSSIWVVHGPPYGVGDKVLDTSGNVTNGESVGSHALREAILQHKPHWVVCGHIHESRGVYKLGDTTVINASMYDHTSGKFGTPFIFDI